MALCLHDWSMYHSFDHTITHVEHRWESIHQDKRESHITKDFTDKDDHVGRWSSQDFAGPRRSNRFQTRFVSRYQDGRRGDVSDECKRSHGLQQGAVPVAITVGFLKILHFSKTKPNKQMKIIITNRNRSFFNRQKSEKIFREMLRIGLSSRSSITSSATFH